MAEASEQRKPRSEASKELKRVAVFKKLEQGSSVVDSWRGRLGTVVESGSVKYHDDTLVRSSIGPLEISVASTADRLQLDLFKRKVQALPDRRLQ